MLSSPRSCEPRRRLARDAAPPTGRDRRDGHHRRHDHAPVRGRPQAASPPARGAPGLLLRGRSPRAVEPRRRASPPPESAARDCSARCSPAPRPPRAGATATCGLLRQPAHRVAVTCEFRTADGSRSELVSAERRSRPGIVLRDWAQTLVGGSRAHPRTRRAPPASRARRRARSDRPDFLEARTRRPLRRLKLSLHLQARPRACFRSRMGDRRRPACAIRPVRTTAPRTASETSRSRSIAAPTVTGRGRDRRGRSRADRCADRDRGEDCVPVAKTRRSRSALRGPPALREAEALEREEVREPPALGRRRLPCSRTRLRGRRMARPRSTCACRRARPRVYRAGSLRRRPDSVFEGDRAPRLARRGCPRRASSGDARRPTKSPLREPEAPVRPKSREPTRRPAEVRPTRSERIVTREDPSHAQEKPTEVRHRATRRSRSEAGAYERERSAEARCPARGAAPVAADPRVLASVRGAASSLVVRVHAARSRRGALRAGLPAEADPRRRARSLRRPGGAHRRLAPGPRRASSRTGR